MRQVRNYLYAFYKHECSIIGIDDVVNILSIQYLHDQIDLLQKGISAIQRRKVYSFLIDHSLEYNIVFNSNNEKEIR